jgi:glucose/arabinose dehydrogenase
MGGSRAAFPRAGAVALAVAACLGAAARDAAAAPSLPAAFADSAIVSGLNFPCGMAFLPDGRLIFVEQKSARIRVVSHGAVAAVDPAAQLTDVQIAGNEQGLLGIAVDPRWPAKPWIYIHCDQPGNTIRVSRYEVTGDLDGTGNGALTVDLSTRYDLFNDAPDAMQNHNGGTLRFGIDGRLYDSLGEDGSYCGAQDTVSLRGVILRLDVSGLPSGPGSAPRALVAAAGNPFAASPDSNARLVWAIGLRNPFRFQVDPLDNTLFVDDVGQDTWEEMDHVTTGGQDFGWPIMEGPAPYFSSCPGLNAVAGVPPIYAYDRSGATSASVGGGVYRRPGGSPTGFPAAYEGDVFMSDFYQGFVRRLKNTAGTWAVASPDSGQADPLNWATGLPGVSDWLVGPDGGLWYCRQTLDPFVPNVNGVIGEIHAVAAVDTTPPPPPPPPDTTGFRFYVPRPTPSNGTVQILYRLPRAMRTEVTILDMFGRRVRTLVPKGTEGPGSIAPHVWDGTDDHGRRLRPGLYFARLSADDIIIQQRVVFLR